MEDDFFSDLVPVKTSATKSTKVQEDAVLPAVAESSNGPANLQGESSPKFIPIGPPMGDSRGKKELREYEAATQVVFEATLKRFAGGLQRVLEDMSRCDAHALLALFGRQASLWPVQELSGPASW